MPKSIINEQCSRWLRQCNDRRKETGDINIMEKITLLFVAWKTNSVFILKITFPSFDY